MEGQKLYNKLYEIGYHNNTGLTQATLLLGEMLNTTHNYTFRSVLDVGASHGFAVAECWKFCVCASGVDVSDVAVKLALQSRLPAASKRNTPICRVPQSFNPLSKWARGKCAPKGRSSSLQPRCADGSCFQRASATALPFANRSFDAIMSSDVLEHLSKKDASLAVREFARVARTHLFLKIADRKEFKTGDLEQLRQAGVSVPESLHLTVQPRAYWLRLFEAAGFRLVKRLPALWWQGQHLVMTRDERPSPSLS